MKTREQAALMATRASASVRRARSRLEQRVVAVTQALLLVKKWERREAFYRKRAAMTDAQLAAEAEKRAPRRKVKRGMEV